MALHFLVPKQTYLLRVKCLQCPKDICMSMKNADIYKVFPFYAGVFLNLMYLQQCFVVLGLSEDTDQNTVRRKYIELVKKLHPDSGCPEASIDKFREVDEAFKILLGKFAKNRRGIFDEEEEAKIFDIKHTAPQHRQYLSFEGIGYGTPFQRQRQYEQYKVFKVQERILEHRVQKVQAKEGDLVKKTTQHKIKTKYGFDRVVEDLIQEAMANGDFNHLSGAGKPLSSIQTQNPYLDFTTHKLNKILIDNGFTPEWIMLQRDIRKEIDTIRNKLINQRQFLGETPFGAQDMQTWELTIATLEKDANAVNKMIDKFNLIVPILNKQLFRIKIKHIADDVLEDQSLPHSRARVNEKQNMETGNSQTSLLSALCSLF